jgi:hypothetical protein
MRRGKLGNWPALRFSKPLESNGRKRRMRGAGWKRKHDKLIVR